METANQLPTKTIGCYRFKVKLQDCECGIIYSADHLLTKQKVTIKILYKQKLKNSSRLNQVAREIAILKKIRHRTILQLYQIIETSDYVYVIMEYIQGVILYDYLKMEKKLKQTLASKIFYQLILALQYLKKIHIVHNNIKINNIYINKNAHIKLINFQESRQVNEIKTNNYPFKKILLGIDSQQNNLFAGDLWDASLILYQLLFGINFSQKKLLSYISSSPKLKVSEGLSTNAISILTLLLTKNKDSKVSVQNIKFHPFICKFETSITGHIYDEQAQEHIMKQLQLFGIDKKYASQCIKKYQCNYVTTLYWLLKKKYIKQKERNSPKTSTSPPIILNSLKNLNKTKSKSKNKKSNNRKDKQNPEQLQGRQSKQQLNIPAIKNNEFLKNVRKKNNLFDKRINHKKRNCSSQPKKQNTSFRKTKKLTLYSIDTDRKKSEESKKMKGNDDYFKGDKCFQKKCKQTNKIRQAH